MTNRPDLYILRHGQTIWNKQGRFQGRKNSALTKTGQEQALNQAKILSNLPSKPINIYVSPQGRTLETAHLALGENTPFTIEPRLQEIAFGQWEGLTKQQIKSQTNDTLDDGTWQFKSPDGETFEMISTRVSAFLNELTEPAIIITHGTTSVILRGLYMGLNQSEMLKLPKGQGCVYHLSNAKENVLV